TRVAHIVREHAPDALVETIGYGNILPRGRDERGLANLFDQPIVDARLRVLQPRLMPRAREHAVLALEHAALDQSREDVKRRLVGTLEQETRNFLRLPARLPRSLRFQGFKELADLSLQVRE